MNIFQVLFTYILHILKFKRKPLQTSGMTDTDVTQQGRPSHSRVVTIAVISEYTFWTRREPICQIVSVCLKCTDNFLSQTQVVYCYTLTQRGCFFWPRCGRQSKISSQYTCSWIFFSLCLCGFKQEVSAVFPCTACCNSNAQTILRRLEEIIWAIKYIHLVMPH